MNKILYWGSRLDRTGLSAQGDYLIDAIRPDIIVSINSSSFNQGAHQDTNKYEGFERYVINGFPTNRDILLTLKKSVTHIFMSESAYNNALYSYAKMRGIKTYNFTNAEYFEPFHIAQKGNRASAQNWPLPSTILLPTPWYESEYRQLLPGKDIRLLRPPITMSKFKKARDINLQRTGRRKFIHVIGRVVSSDRAGTFSVLDALKHCKEDFELVIKCQHEIPEYMAYSDDRRILWDIRDVPNNEDLYADADVLLHPRRFGGLNLVMCEALASGLPCIMTNVSPNEILPSDWLISSNSTSKLQTRLLLGVYSADVQELAAKMDELATISDKELQAMKSQALDIAYDNFSESVFIPKYKELI